MITQCLGKSCAYSTGMGCICNFLDLTPIDMSDGGVKAEHVGGCNPGCVGNSHVLLGDDPWPGDPV